MSHSQTGDEGGPSIASRTLDSALAEMRDCRREFLQRHQYSASNDERFLRRFHAAVITVYCELRPYRRENALGTKWDNARMWKDETGQWVQGVDALAEWAIAERESESRGRGMSAGRRATVEPAHLDADLLLRCSWILDRLAVTLGRKIDVSKGKRPLALLDNPEKEAELQDYREQEGGDDD